MHRPADRCISGRSAAGFADFVANNTTHGRAADGPEGAATCQKRTADSTDASTDGGILALSRHTRAATQAKQQDRGRYTERKFLYDFHGIPSCDKVESNGLAGIADPTHFFAKSMLPLTVASCFGADLHAGWFR